MGERPLKIAIVAAEPSGDWQAGAMAQAIKDSGVPVEMYGVGGHCMAKAGVTIWQDSQDVSCIGPADAIGRLHFFYSSFFRLQRKLKELQPDLTVMLDSPALNMRLAKFLRRNKLRSLYYIPPSAWTTSVKRLRQIHDRVDGVACIFKFNADRYEEAGLKVAYFGHPILDVYAEDGVTEAEAREELGAKGEVLAVLPGSRDQEVRNLMPQFTELAEQLLAEHSEAEVFIPCATKPLYDYVVNFLGDRHPRFHVVMGKTRSILRIARVALTASGSATLEATMCGVPLAICYRFGWLNALIGRFLLASGLLRYDSFGLPNLLLQRRAIPEFLQDEVCSERILPLLRDLWEDTPVRAQMVADLAQAKANLGEAGVLRQLAEVVVSMAQGQTIESALEHVKSAVNDN